MRNTILPVLLMGALLTAQSLCIQECGAQQHQSPVRKMSITGEIAKAAHGYIIRGSSPAEVFTILNPRLDVLDPLSGKTVRITARIVSGDNVEIEKIDGKEYGAATGADHKNY